MKTSKLVTFFLFLGSFIIWTFSCTNSKENDEKQDHFVTIDLQPFTDISKEESNFVATELKKIYPHIILLKPIEIPKTAFYPRRNRYRADSLIHYLSNRTPKNHVTIGLTTKDISTTKDKVADWGIMGLGFCPGVACIASSYRLSKNEKLTQLFKVSIHELGHTQGLPNCAVKYCFMRDAEGQNLQRFYANKLHPFGLFHAK